MTTFRDLLIHAEDCMQAAGCFYGHGYESAHDEAVAVVLHCAGLPIETGAEILDRPVSQALVTAVSEALVRRCEHREPLAYITGEAWLGPLSFLVDRRALVPRSPLAQLIQAEFHPWLAHGPPTAIVDVCCGGGSLGILAATVFPNAQVTLADLDSDALALAHDNVRRHNLGERIQLIQCDLLDEIAPASVDVIIANPPYVDQQDMDALPPEYQHEPSLALAAGDDGLDLVHRLLLQAAHVLRDDGLLLLEVGNSWSALEAAYPEIEWIWIALDEGGIGVTVVTARALQHLRSSSRL
jgi:ribosomal protein L3 glutamine methyltransferase